MSIPSASSIAAPRLATPSWLSWSEIHFVDKEIERVTQKRKKKVVLLIPTELLFALEAEYARRRPLPSERVAESFDQEFAHSASALPKNARNGQAR